LPEFALHDFDEVGVPANADKAWRQRTTEAWLARGFANETLGRSTMICGGAVLGEILACPTATKVPRVAVCLLDCSDLARIDRLKPRGAQGATQDTLNWAAWQRVHVVDPQWRPDVITGDAAPELDFSVWSSWQRGDARWRAHSIDTTPLSVAQVAAEISAWVGRESNAR
jgi:hypothetical protein